MSTRVTPGVQVRVVKEIVPQQLYPAGMVGFIGTSRDGPILKPQTVTSYRELVEIFGPEEPGFTLQKEAKQAFLNGVFQVVATRIGGASSSPPSLELRQYKKNSPVLKLTAKEPGAAGNRLQVVVMKSPSIEGGVRIEITDSRKNYEVVEGNLNKADEPNYIVDQINKNSKIVNAEPLISETGPENVLKPFEGSLEGGTFEQPTDSDYEKALELLELEPNIDGVHVCDNWNPKIHALVDAHCQNMSLGKEPKPLGPRIGIGTVSPGESIEDILKRSEVLASDRFILCAPYGVGGAVAGLISKLNYYESPTFKPLTGIADIERRYTPSEQMKLITNGVLVVDAVRGRGIIAVKGITTSKDQISVMRIADRAVRGIKSISELFIGTLNNSSGRMALKERIREYLASMEKEGSLVPSTDGTQPAYLIDVYSTQIDFAQGIVRVDVAVRPVRAMDYIYATVTVTM